MEAPPNEERGYYERESRNTSMQCIIAVGFFCSGAGISYLISLLPGSVMAILSGVLAAWCYFICASSKGPPTN